jgi:hypothetical protein
MIAIRFTDESRSEEGLRLLQQYQEGVSIGDPDTYIVSERILTVLEQAHVPFTRVENGEAWLTEEILDDMRQGFDDMRHGRSTVVPAPLSVKELAAIARRKGLR